MLCWPFQQPGRECRSLAPRAQLLPPVQPHRRCLWMWVVPGVSSAQEDRGWCWALCPGGLGDSPFQQCHSPGATHHCCWWLGTTWPRGARRSLLPPSVLCPDILGCPGVALPPSAMGLVPSPHLGTAHLSHPFPCYCSLPGCLTLAVRLYRGCSGRAGLSRGPAASPCLCPAHSLHYPGVCQPGLGPSLCPGEGREEQAWPWVSFPVLAPSAGVTR